MIWVNLKAASIKGARINAEYGGLQRFYDCCGWPHQISEPYVWCVQHYPEDPAQCVAARRMAHHLTPAMIELQHKEGYWHCCVSCVTSTGAVFRGINKLPPNGLLTTIHSFEQIYTHRVYSMSQIVFGGHPRYDEFAEFVKTDRMIFGQDRFFREQWQQALIFFNVADDSPLFLP